MTVTTKKLTVGFRNIEEALELMVNTLREIAVKVEFQYNDELNSVIECLTSRLIPLTYAQILTGIEVQFADEEIDVKLEYYPDPDEEDELDVSFLSLVSCDVDKLTLGIVLSDKEYASYLVTDNLSDLATDHIDILMIDPQSSLSEEKSKVSSEGSDH